MIHKHNHSSNNEEVFRTFIGCKIKGIAHDNQGESRSAVVLVFDCGWGLGLNYNGSYWSYNPEEIKSLLNKSRESLEDTIKELKNVLHIAGG